MSDIKKLDFESEFFDLYKLSESAYGAISKEDSPMGSNAGFIDIGDYLIIIDTTLHAGAAEDLKQAALKYTKKESNFIVITHYHMDHIVGNSVFDKNTQIITSDRTLMNIKTESKKSFEQYRNFELEKIVELEESLEFEKDDEKIQDIKNDLRFLKGIRTIKEIREPNLTFKQGCIIHGEQKHVHLQTFQKAHTDGDVIVYIPDEKVLFAGDLLFANRDPWIGSGDPEGWLSVNNELITLDFDVTVPGHGNLASKKEFSLQNKYIREMIDLVKKYISSGEDPTQITRKDFSIELQSWNSITFEWNINFLVESLKKS
jgi:glyoxylase-like metal-dependent hydrolase (beta-lactamase superfamily II)